MALIEQSWEDESHPIDMVETLAESQEWEFDRIADNQIAMAVEGQWRTYAVTLAWSAGDETLRLVCSFDMEPPPERLPALYELLNEINDRSWTGAFTYWAEQRMLVFRSSLPAVGTHGVSAEQIDALVGAAVEGAERYNPAIHLVLWGECGAEEAMRTAIGRTFGNA